MHTAFTSQSIRIPRPAAVNQETGAVLLEVVLALVLFVGAATVLTSGLSQSLDSVERLRLNTHAIDLAVTVVSELQLGIKTLALSGPQPFEPEMEGWTWEAVAAPAEGGTDDTNAVRSVEVVIRHEDPPVLFRLTQVLRTGSASTSRETQDP